MLFLTAEKRTTLPVAPPGGGGGKTYMGNARLKTFFHLDAFSLSALFLLHFSALFFLRHLFALIFLKTFT